MRIHWCKSVFTRACVASALFLFGSVHANELKVFGLPLGGSVPQEMKACVDDGKPTSKLCWLGAPFFYKQSNSTTGAARLPASALPEWAQNSTASITLSKHRVLDSIELRVSNPQDEKLIESSISARFGKGRARLMGSYQITNWDLPDISIELFCSRGNYCTATFLSASMRDAVAKEVAARDTVKRSLPASP